MATETAALPLDNLEEIFGEPDLTELDGLESAGGPEPAADSATGLVARVKASRRHLFGLVFLAGIVLGWTVIGWWLWPVTWTNSSPWDLNPQHQRTYVLLVAENFWRTSDVAKAKAAVAGWNPDDLAELINTMKTETGSAETRRELAALADALQMPGRKQSLAGSILGQRGLLIGGLLALVPLIGAVVVFASPLLRKGELEDDLPAPEEQTEENLEELLSDVQLEQQAQEGQAPEAQQGQEGQKPPEEQQQPSEEEEQQESGLGDLASLFEEEDTSLSALELFCKNLAELEISGLSENATQVARQLRDLNSQKR